MCFCYVILHWLICVSIDFSHNPPPCVAHWGCRVGVCQDPAGCVGQITAQLAQSWTSAWPTEPFFVVPHPHTNSFYYWGTPLVFLNERSTPAGCKASSWQQAHDGNPACFVMQKFFALTAWGNSWWTQNFCCLYHWSFQHANYTCYPPHHRDACVIMLTQLELVSAHIIYVYSEAVSHSVDLCEALRCHM